MPPTPEHWGPRQLATTLGTAPSLIDRARDMGLIAPPDTTGRWPADTVNDIRAHWPEIVDKIAAARDLGAVRSAELLARRTGLPVRADDVSTLADRGLLRVTRQYKHRPLYLLTEVEALAADAVARAQLADIVAVRQGSAAPFSPPRPS